MSRQTKRSLCFTIALFVLFLILTVVLKTVDVQPVGPNDSKVGLATINTFMLERSSGAEVFKTISDWIGYLALAMVFGLAVYGLIQWIRRKDIRKVDADLLVAGGIYVLTGLLYILFEFVIVNYRPALEDGKLAASYPSSHTMMAVVILLTVVMLLEKRIANRLVFHLLSFLLDAAVVLMVLFRQQSGIHWFTDIIGGMLLGGTLIMLFQFAVELLADKGIGVIPSVAGEAIPERPEEHADPEDGGEGPEEAEKEPEPQPETDPKPDEEICAQEDYEADEAREAEPPAEVDTEAVNADQEEQTADRDEEDASCQKSE